MASYWPSSLTEQAWSIKDLSHDDKENFFAELTREIPFCALGLPECSQDLRDVAFSDLLRDVSAIFQTDSFSEFPFPLSSRIQEIWS